MFEWLFGKDQKDAQQRHEDWLTAMQANPISITQDTKGAESLNQSFKDAERFRKLCDLSTNNPTAFRKIISQALTLDEYRKAVDEA